MVQSSKLDPMSGDARFTKKTIDFLKEASEQTSPDWLKKHKKEHEEFVISPLRSLTFYLIQELSKDPASRGYKFPRRGFGRLRRPASRVGRGEPAYRNFVHIRAARPSKSIFDENPGLYFYLSPEEIFAGGGLYEASSRQVKKVRAWLADDPKEMIDLLRSKTFKREFPNGFETEKVLKTFPRFYPQDHKRIEWLRLQAFYVLKDYTKRELYSSEFKDLILENWRQVLRFNGILEDVLNAETDGFQAAPAVEEEPEESSSSEDLWDDRL
jgi:uncharacterized protein (TIGR02453 family)